MQRRQHVIDLFVWPEAGPDRASTAAFSADGYNILPAHFPGAFDEFVDLVIPELQRRYLFRKEYEGTTLRDHFGLPPVPAPMPPREAVGAE